MKITTLDLGEYQPHLLSPGVGAWRYAKRLPLTAAPGQLRMIALGVGAAFSTKMYQANFIIIKGSTTLFVDLGSKATLKMAEFGLSAHDVKHLVITHLHADHIGSLEEVALKRRYEAPFIELPKRQEESFPEYFGRIIAARNEGRFRPTLYIPEHYEKLLWDWSLRGGLAFSEKTTVQEPKGEMLMSHYFKVVHPQKVDHGYVDTWEVMVPGSVPEDELHLQIHLTNHVPDSAADVSEAFYTTGFMIDGRIMVSGDTKFDRASTMHYGKDEIGRASCRERV